MKKLLLILILLFITNIANAVDCNTFKFNTNLNIDPGAAYQYNEYEYIMDCQVPNVQTKKNYKEVLSNLNDLLIRFGNEDYYGVFTLDKKYKTETDAYKKAIAAYVKVIILKDLETPNKPITSKYEEDLMNDLAIVQECDQYMSTNTKMMLSSLTIKLRSQGAFNNSDVVDTYLTHLYTIIKLNNEFKTYLKPYMIMAAKYNDSKHKTRAELKPGDKDVLWYSDYVQYLLGD